MMEHWTDGSGHA